MSQATITWTIVDEAPALASYSLLPIIKSFTKNVDINIEPKDISLSGRILATFPEHLNATQKINDSMSDLGKLVKKKEANIIKLPNISASVSQLKAAISELQSKGYNIPSYPENPKTEEDKAIKKRYAKCLGSAVNPVLREGNADRRAAVAVKKYAQNHPHKLKSWRNDSLTNVAHMDEDDFFGNEKSIIKNTDGKVRIVLTDNDGNKTTLGEIDALDKEILDATYMGVKSLRNFYTKTLEDAKKENTLYSLHLKATMMKVSDPIMFGHAVNIFFKDVFEKYSNEFNEIGINPNLGLGDLYIKLDMRPQEKKEEIQEAIMYTYKKHPASAMVNSDNGITNLHNSNDVIIDASMPVVIRDGGKMWNWDGQLQETKTVIPDRTYATFYKECVNDCKINGQFDVATMGNVSNVGLMAQKAEEYGSHPTTFEIPENGHVDVIDENNQVLMSHNVEKGDIWRMSRTKDIPVKDWVRLGVERARLTGNPAVFLLDEKRPHDLYIISRVKEYLKDHNTKGLEISIMSPVEAMKYTLKRVRKGENTISVTGNVFRDYLTDLFPILELGTSAKMLSIVPLIAGGGLFETGAGGSAPKHVQQFLKEGHLRWDSLGEFLALAESLRFMYQKSGDKRIEILTKALDEANDQYLTNGKSPSRVSGEPDAKASHYYLASYWAKALAEQKDDSSLSQIFKAVAEQLEKNEEKIIKELLSIEGKATDIGGYYKPDFEKASKAMRPSNTLNTIIDAI
jgi:isocitrate dehydrogenase